MARALQVLRAGQTTMVGFFSKLCKQGVSVRLGRHSLAVFTLVCSALTLGGCADGGYQSISGATMGTYYRVQADCPVLLNKADIDKRLREFNAVFSTYEPQSELSQLNLADTQQWRVVSAKLMMVLEAAAKLTAQSDGAFDPTVGALVNLWGFGPGDELLAPDAQTLTRVLAETGFDAVELDPSLPGLRSSQKRVIDLSALAKGRAVDELAATLAELDCAAALVDIGGEIRVFGKSPSKRAWRLAVEQPGQLSDGSKPLPVIVITGGAVATSGDYRNYREVAGNRVSHLIDPRTANPISHGLASVTVWHPEAMWADGYATAISVLGPEAGQALANRAKLAVAMLIRTADGRFEPWMSDAFAARFDRNN